MGLVSLSSSSSPKISGETADIQKFVNPIHAAKRTLNMHINNAHHFLPRAPLELESSHTRSLCLRRRFVLASRKSLWLRLGENDPKTGGQYKRHEPWAVLCANFHTRQARGCFLRELYGCVPRSHQTQEPRLICVCVRHWWPAVKAKTRYRPGTNQSFFYVFFPSLSRAAAQVPVGSRGNKTGFVRFFQIIRDQVRQVLAEF
jgi:hypothetical protein